MSSSLGHYVLLFEHRAYNMTRSDIHIAVSNTHRLNCYNLSCIILHPIEPHHFQAHLITIHFFTSHNVELRIFSSLLISAGYAAETRPAASSIGLASPPFVSGPVRSSAPASIMLSFNSRDRPCFHGDCTVRKRSEHMIFLSCTASSDLCLFPLLECAVVGL
jgi:hypothetical protein